MHRFIVPSVRAFVCGIQSFTLIFNYVSQHTRGILFDNICGFY